MNVRQYGWALVYALCGLVVVLLLMTVSAIREGQQQRGPIIEQTGRAAHAAEAGTQRIEDCTTPGRECYDQGQKRLARVVAGLTTGTQQAAAAATACALTIQHAGKPVTYHTVYRCIVRTTKPQDRKR